MSIVYLLAATLLLLVVGLGFFLAVRRKGMEWRTLEQYDIYRSSCRKEPQ